MQKNTFRQESRQRLLTPKQLDKYLRVSAPGVWIVLAAVAVLLAGAVVWGCLGRIETTEDVAMFAEDGVNVAYIRSDEMQYISVGSVIRKDTVEYYVADIDYDEPVMTDDLPTKVQAKGNYPTGMWLYRVCLTGETVYDIQQASLVLESRQPLSFLFALGGNK